MDNWLLGLITAMLAFFIGQIMYVAIDNHTFGIMLSLLINLPILYGSSLLAKKNVGDS
jgi:threonine/homoserine efflux transporter RhtA